MELFAITTFKKSSKKQLTFLKSQVLQSNISITPELQSLHQDFHKVDKYTFNSILNETAFNHHFVNNTPWQI